MHRTKNTVDRLQKQVHLSFCLSATNLYWLVRLLSSWGDGLISEEIRIVGIPHQRIGEG